MGSTRVHTMAEHAHLPGSYQLVLLALCWVYTSGTEGDPTAMATHRCGLQAVAGTDHAAAAAAGAGARQMVRKPLLPCLANALRYQS